MSADVSQIDVPSAKSSGPETTTVTAQTAIDRRLDQLIKDVLPMTPYILRLQQSSDRRLPQPSQAYHWRQGTLFSPDEQELQYMTFRRPLDNMLHAHGQWDDGRGGIAPRDNLLSHNSSGHTPLQGPGVKKKITLADYKNRDKGKTGIKEPVSEQLESVIEANKLKSSQPELESNGEVRLEQPDGKKEVALPNPDIDVPAVDEIRSIKRSAESLDDAKSKTNEGATEPPTKRPRASVEGPPQKVKDSKDQAIKSCQKSAVSEVKLAEPEAHVSKDPIIQAVLARSDGGGHESIDLSSQYPSNGKEHSHLPSMLFSENMPDDKKHSQLPPILSPTLPNVEAYKLPPLLSPNLPPEIEAAIAEAKANRPKSNGSITTNSRASSGSISSHRPRSNTATSLSQNSGSRIAKSKSPMPSNTGNRHNDRSTSTSNHAAVKDQRPTKELPKPEKVIVLKIKKKHWSRLSQYLRLKPTPSKVHWKRRLTSQPYSIESESSKPLLPNSKRESIQEHSEPTKKRKQGSDHLPQRPATPILPAASPLSSKHASTQKPRLGGPQSHPSSAAMRRAGSGQGIATTPLGQSRHVTPSAIDKESPSKQELRAECRAESARLIRLGQDLKHDSDPFLRAENPTAEQERLGLVFATEAVLCFILAWVIADEPPRREGISGNASQWKSMLQYMSVLRQGSKSYQHLHGLLSQLEGVIRDTIHHYDLFSIRSMLRELDKSNGAQQQESTLQRYHSQLKECNDNETRALAAWRDGHAALWVTDIQSVFPKTWSQARQTPGRGKGQDLVQIREYKKDGFALPMGSLTSGLEAVNAGLSLLFEFCEKEKISWKPKLVL